MPHATALAFPEENLIGWECAMIAFLVEKERRSGSRRTVEGYSRMLQDFFGGVPKAPDKVTAQEVFLWAHGKGLSGRDPSPVTIGARMACLSSFFRFLIRMDIVQRIPVTGWSGRGPRPRQHGAFQPKRCVGFWRSFPILLRVSATEPSSSPWSSPVAEEQRYFA